MILLDTHALIWWLLQSPQLSKNAAKRINEELKVNKILVSSISIWEISLLAHKNRLPLSVYPDIWLKKIEGFPELEFVPVNNTIAFESTILPGTFHSDPADRFIVATARVSGAALLTKDAKIRKYKHVETIW